MYSCVVFYEVFMLASCFFRVFHVFFMFLPCLFHIIPMIFFNSAIPEPPAIRIELKYTDNIIEITCRSLSKYVKLDRTLRSERGSSGLEVALTVPVC